MSSTENIQKIQALVEMNANLSIRAISSDTGINKETVRQILRNQLGLKKLCSKWVPHRLSEKNITDTVVCANEIIQLIENNTSTDLLRR